MKSGVNSCKILLFYIFVAFGSTACDSSLSEGEKQTIEKFKLKVSDFLSSGVSSNREELYVVSTSPEPNYKINQDVNDNIQLVDGKILPTPMWIEKESVGWVGHSTVVIRLKRRRTAMESGKLRIHSGIGQYAGVFSPHWIDVYSNNVTQGFQHVGSYDEKTSTSIFDKYNHWQEVSVSQVSGDLVIVMHVQGAYLQIDEIEFVPDQAKDASTQQKVIKGVKDVKSDSIARLRKNLTTLANKRVNNSIAWRNHFGADKILGWVVDPWEVTIKQRAVDSVSLENTSISIEGTNSEYEHVAIALHNTGKSDRVLNIGISAFPSDGYRLFELMPVATSTGKNVYDPLVPLTQNNILLRPGQEHILWIKIDLRILPPGKYKFDLNLLSDNLKFDKTFLLNMEISDSSRLTHASLQTMVWAYSNDTPVWRIKEQAVIDQSLHYVNTWVMHPSNIPGRRLTEKVNQNELKRFREDLTLYKGRGVVRLYLGWYANKNPLGLGKGKYIIQKEEKAKFRRWLVILQGWMKQEGYNDDQWELYPIDEPTGYELTILKSIAEVVKQTLPNIKIYANPASTNSDPSNIEHLEALSSFVDVWQPRFDFATDASNTFFLNSNRVWGFYDNPARPAKLASPLESYRKQGWLAWSIGAQSIGFWSYSDSTRSSVWNDFDGRRPDYAVVYESQDKLVSSRRWEAFAEGVEDYKLLMGSALPKIEFTSDNHFDSEFINSWRSKALNQIHD